MKGLRLSCGDLPPSSARTGASAGSLGVCAHRSSCGTTPQSSGQSTNASSVSSTPTEDTKEGCYCSYKPPGAAETEFDDEDDMAASCLLSLIEAAKEQNAARRRSTPRVVGSRASSRLNAQRASVLAPLSAPAVLGGNFRSFGAEGDTNSTSPGCPQLPAGSLFESLYHGVNVAGTASVAEPFSPGGATGYGMAVEGLMDMYKETRENEQLILALANAVDMEMGE